MGRICPNIMKKLNSYLKMFGYCHAISNGADKFEVKHWDHRFTVDLQAMTCSCRYWQLSGLPCCHAISSVYFKTNSLDHYIADCYTVKNLRKTYQYWLELVEGQESWPISNRENLRAPGYIKMPGRSKTQRTREPHEKPKTTKVSRVGTVIRCTKCKCTVHNRSSCDRRNGKANTSNNNGQGSKGTPASNPANAPTPDTGTGATTPATAPIAVPRTEFGTQQGSTSSKRKLSLRIGSQDSVGPNSSMSNVSSTPTFPT